MNQDVYIVLQTLGFGVGAILYIGLSHKAFPRRHQAGGSLALSLFAILCAIWNLGRLIAVSLPLHSERDLAVLANTIAFASLAWLPSALALVIRPQAWSSLGQRRTARALAFLSWTIATALGVNVFVSWLGPPSWAGLLIAYNLFAHVVVVSILFRRTTRQSLFERRFVAIQLGIATALVALLALYLHVELASLGRDIVLVLSQQSSLMAALASGWFLSRFRFIDVYLKRSVTIVLVVGIATILAFASAHILGIEASEPVDRARRLLVTTSFLGLVLGFLLWRAPWLDRSLDRILWNRPDYPSVAASFREAVAKTSLASECLTLLRNSLSTHLPLPWIDISETSSTPMLPPAMAIRGEWMLGASTTGLRITVASPKGNRGLLSEEAVLAETLVACTGQGLERIRREEERVRNELARLQWQARAVEAELKALRAQIHPHFLFNALNTIAELIATEPRRAERMTERLAALFRHVLKRHAQPMTTLGEELEFLRSYLEIEKVRFGERLDIHIKAPKELMAQEVPSWILQPLVENSMRHGLHPKVGRGRLEVVASSHGDELVLTIRDDGIGCQTPHKPGIGLKNVEKRLQTLYGERGHLTFSSEPRLGTSVVIRLPLVA